MNFNKDKRRKSSTCLMEDKSRSIGRKMKTMKISDFESMVLKNQISGEKNNKTFVIGSAGAFNTCAKIQGLFSQERRGPWTPKEFGAISLNQPVEHFGQPLYFCLRDMLLN